MIASILPVDPVKRVGVGLAVLGIAVYTIQRVGIRPAGVTAILLTQINVVSAKAVRTVQISRNLEFERIYCSSRAVGDDLLRVEHLIDGVCFAVRIAALQQLKGKARLAGGNVAALLHRLCDGNLHFDVCFFIRVCVGTARHLAQLICQCHRNKHSHRCHKTEQTTQELPSAFPFFHVVSSPIL